MSIPVNPPSLGPRSSVSDEVLSFVVGLLIAIVVVAVAGAITFFITGFSILDYVRNGSGNEQRATSLFVTLTGVFLSLAFSAAVHCWRVHERDRR